MPMFMKKKGVSIMTKMTYLDAIRQAQDVAMEKDQNTFILGEDVGKKVAYSVLLLVYKVNMVKNASLIHL